MLILTISAENAKKIEMKKIKIPAIKMVRAITGMGLKEAKEAIDTLLADLVINIRVGTNFVLRKNDILSMEDLGISITTADHGPRQTLLADLQTLAVMAIYAKNIQLAYEIIQFFVKIGYAEILDVPELEVNPSTTNINEKIEELSVMAVLTSQHDVSNFLIKLLDKNTGD